MGAATRMAAPKGLGRMAAIGRNTAAIGLIAAAIGLMAGGGRIARIGAALMTRIAPTRIARAFPLALGGISTPNGEGAVLGT